MLSAASIGLLLSAAAAAVGTPERQLDIWMVPHAHCDVGWLMSLDGEFPPLASLPAPSQPAPAPGQA